MKHCKKRQQCPLLGLDLPVQIHRVVPPQRRLCKIIVGPDVELKDTDNLLYLDTLLSHKEEVYLIMSTYQWQRLSCHFYIWTKRLCSAV
jgi:hypothetical protein